MDGLCTLHHSITSDTVLEPGCTQMGKRCQPLATKIKQAATCTTATRPIYSETPNYETYESHTVCSHSREHINSMVQTADTTSVLVLNTRLHLIPGILISAPDIKTRTSARTYAHTFSSFIHSFNHRHKQAFSCAREQAICYLSSLRATNGSTGNFILLLTTRGTETCDVTTDLRA